MNNEIIKMASTQGIWALLTVLLIFYILKSQEKIDSKQDKREKNYQNIIAKLTDKLNILEDVKNEVNEIKSYITNKKQKGDL